MNTKLFLFAAVLLSVVGADAATLSQVVTRQQWPWSSKVRIDYALTCEAGESCDVDVVIKDEQGAVISSLDNAFTGDRREVGSGEHVIWWDPTASGAENLPKFLTFELTAANDPQRYIVIDIATTNSCVLTYSAQPPKGGFNTDEYKTTKIVFKRVKAGSFIMGTPEDEEGRRTVTTGNFVADMPRHQVTLTRDFWMGLFPLTYQQASIINRGECGKTWTYAGNQKSSSPAVNQSLESLIGWGGTGDPDWFKAPVPREGSLLYRLAESITVGTLPEGTHLGLPTEAQWEYACRAGTTTPFNNGTDSIAGVGPEQAYTNPMHPVGAYSPNAWGFYDFHQCIWQWTIDSFSATIGTDSVADPFAPLSKDSCWPAMRGGSYGTSGLVTDCRSGSRYYRTYNNKSDFSGARLVIVKKP